MSSWFLPNNEAATDRLLRVVLGLVLLSIVLFGPKSLWGCLGLIPLTAGLIGCCPLYKLSGISTCPLHATRQTTAR